MPGGAGTRGGIGEFGRGGGGWGARGGGGLVTVGHLPVAIRLSPAQASPTPGPVAHLGASASLFTAG